MDGRNGGTLNENNWLMETGISTCMTFPPPLNTR